MAGVCRDDAAEAADAVVQHARDERGGFDGDVCVYPQPRSGRRGDAGRPAAGPEADHAVYRGDPAAAETLARISHTLAGAGSVLAAPRGFRALPIQPGIGGGAKTPWHDNALRHHPAMV